MEIEIKAAFDAVINCHENDPEYKRHVNNLRCFTQDDVKLGNYEEAITNVSGLMGAMLVETAYAPSNKVHQLEECVYKLSALLVKLELGGGITLAPAAEA